MAEPWQIEEWEREERTEKAREEREANERKEAQAREEAKDKRDEEHEKAEREREEASEKKQETREQETKAKDEAETAARNRLPIRPAESFTAGGGPSFLLSVKDEEGVTESGGVRESVGPFPEADVLHGALPREESEKNKYVQITSTSTKSVMGGLTVAPGSTWAIDSIYLRYPAYIKGDAINAEPITGIFSQLSVSATLFRGASPVWIQNAVANPNVLTFPGVTNFSYIGFHMFVLATEFTSPVILFPGENLTLSMMAQGEMSWSNAAKGDKNGWEGGGVARTQLVNSPIKFLPREGVIRYNVEVDKPAN
jgi:hypothetical protein